VREVAAFLAGLAVAILVGAGFAAAEPQGLTWAEIAQLPDFATGVWVVDPASRPHTVPELTAAYRDRVRADLALVDAGKAPDALANCVPPGMPSIMFWPPINPYYPIQFLFSPGEVAIQAEFYQQVRHIHTDGRPLPDDPDETFNGASVGRWEGGTLVVETVGVTPQTPAVKGRWEFEHSARMRITERMRLTDPDTLAITTTVVDPEALSRPWTFTWSYKRHRDWSIREYVCEQNNKDAGPVRP
jgi:hypothetical protein